jgi:hypothetical protein
MLDGNKGLSSVVTVTLLVLGTVVGVAALWAFISKSINDPSKELSAAECYGINLQISNCKAYGQCSYSSGNGFYEAEILVKRNIGQGNVTGLRFIFEDPTGYKGVVDREISIGETGSVQFGSGPNPRIIMPAALPKLVRVAPLIGKNKEVCPIASKQIKCNIIQEPPPTGAIQLAPQCCQTPQNYSQCYNGGDSNYPIVGGIVQNTPLGSPPPGNRSVCCGATSTSSAPL